MASQSAERSFSAEGRWWAFFSSPLGANVNNEALASGNGKDLGVIWLNVKVPDKKVRARGVEDALESNIEKILVSCAAVLSDWAEVIPPK